MKNILNSVIVIAVVMLFLKTNSANGQFSADVDGKLDVSPINGNLTYSYPISNNSVDGYPLTVNLNYSSNVSMSAFYAYINDTSSECPNCDGWSRMSRVHPAWIIGVNGFAVQVLGYKNKFFSYDDLDEIRIIFDSTYSMGQWIYWTKVVGYTPKYLNFQNERNLIWQVEGFDYCNRMHRLRSNGDQDAIKLLRADGSILELRNKVQKTSGINENDSSLYTGFYYEPGVNSNGFAIVVYDTSDTNYYFSTLIQNLLPNNSTRTRFYPRILKYYAGDGLEYVFKEYIAPYINVNKKDENYIKAIELYPTVFDLTEINSSMGQLTHIDRYKEGGFRSILKGLNNHKFNWGEKQVTIEALDRTIKFKGFSKLMFNSKNVHDQTFRNETIDEYEYPSGFALGGWGFYYEGFEDNGGMGSLDLITDIYDAENRHSRFSYQRKETNYNNFTCIPNDNSLLFQTFRIDTIYEPTRSIILAYQSGDDTVNSADLANRDKLDFDHMNVVDSLVYPTMNFPKLDKSKVQYSFSGKTTEYDRKTKLTYSTYLYSMLDRQDSTLIYFKKETVPAAKINSLQDYYSPDEEFMYPIKVENFSGDLVSRTETVMKPMSDLGGESNFFFYPEKEVTKIHQGSGEGDTLILNNIKYEYEFETINDLSDDDTLISAYGQGLKSMRKVTFRPDDDTDTLFKEITELINLKYMVRNVSSYTDKVWNRFVSDTLTRWFRNQRLDTTALVFNTSNYSLSFEVPPIWGMTKSIVISDGEDNILGGKINYYDTAFSVSSNPSNRRGAIISDTIIGKDGARLFGKKYEYTGGWYRNFLKTATNAIGVGSRLFYDYTDIGALSGRYPTGMKLLNTNMVQPESLTQVRHEFEAPVASDNYIRKYHPEGLVTDTLRKFIEKTYYGQIAATIDENGWYWQNEYDKNGRLLYNWHPFDFPHMVEPFPVPQDKCSPLVGKTTITRKRYDTIATDNHHISFGGEIVSYNPYDLLVGNTIRPSLALNQDSLPANQVQVIEENEAVMYYVANDLDPIQSMNNITQAYLSMLLSGNTSSRNIIIEISSDRFGFKQRIILGGKDIELLPGDLPEEVNPILPEFRVNLMPILDSLRTLSNGEAVEFRLRSLNPEGMLSVNQFADDNEPRICARGTALDPHQDYTFRYVYDDSLRTTDTYSKIDDYLHTTRKGWVPSFPDEFDGRYTKASALFIENNLVSNKYLYIGNPDNPDRIDSIRNYYDGAGNLTWVDDQLNYRNEMDYDHLGRLKSYRNTDYTTKSNEYKLGKPEDLLDLSGNNYQDFYGVCSAVISRNEENKRFNSYYDAMGKLRRTIADSSGLCFMTKYEYDLSGNLKYVINPEGDTTKYWYDEFNRMIYKHSPDIDFVSTAYDKLGQVRFAQSKEQAADDRLSFIEYDDLGRMTIIGEARINTTGLEVSEPVWDENLSDYLFSRLTDILDPDVLHYDDFGVNDAGLLSANSTIWVKPLLEMPLFPSYFDSTSVYIPDSSYIDQGYTPVAPYIMHEAWIYQAADTIAGPEEFEDIGKYPQFIRTAIWYDELPFSTGSIWSNFPSQASWDSLAPRTPWGGTPARISNLKGRQSAIAYRDDSGEPYHYVVMSYDPRGRVEAVIRYNENLGYDGVYYTYNSQNKVLRIKAVDPLRQYITWYGYDDNGRVDSVWTKLDTLGSGYGIGTARYPSDPPRPDTPDIVYYYNKRGGIDSTIFVPINVRQRFVYNSRGWLDSMVANRLYDQLFIQVLERDATGLVLSQTSQHQGQGVLVQQYSYDNLKRLTAWTDQNESIEFAYDKLGNRQWTFNGTDSSIYSYSATQRNRLNEVSGGIMLKQFQYNLNGAVNMAWTAGPMDTTYEYFSYNPGGSLRSYTRQSGDKLRKWLYRQSPLGGREQKRLIDSDIGDTLGRSHAWVYYQLGAGGQQVARWHGRQTSDSVSPAEKGRRVYMYPHSYLTNGGELTVYPDTSKEYHITDAQGTVRQVLRWKEGTLTAKSYDYRPFGDSLSATGELPNQGYANMEQDEESEYIQMGARTYNPALGRFMSVDPLAEAFPGQSAYSYAFNSPLSWSDPSGMAPEKERKRDRVLGMDMEDFWIGYDLLMEACQRIETENAMTHFLVNSMIGNPFSAGQGVGFGGGGSAYGATATMTFNGTSSVIENGKWDIVFNYTCNIPLSTGATYQLPVNIYASCLGQNEKHYDVASAFLGGINMILLIDPTYFDELYGKNLMIKIRSSDEVKWNGKKAAGITYPQSDGSIIIDLSVDYLMGRLDYKYNDNYDQKQGMEFKMTVWEIIAHEVAHALDCFKVGYDEWLFYHNETGIDLAECLAIERLNNLRESYNSIYMFNQCGKQYNDYFPGFRQMFYGIFPWFKTDSWNKTWGKYIH